MCQFLLTGVDFARHLGEAGTEIFDELDQVLHALDDFGHGQVVENFLALANDLAHFRLVEAQQQRRRSLKDPARSFNQLLTEKTTIITISTFVQS